MWGRKCEKQGACGIEHFRSGLSPSVKCPGGMTLVRPQCHRGFPKPLEGQTPAGGCWSQGRCLGGGEAGNSPGERRRPLFWSSSEGQALGSVCWILFHSSSWL